jgi:glycosyltransferase involved in cell wall biosynthesis
MPSRTVSPSGPREARPQGDRSLAVTRDSHHRPELSIVMPCLNEAKTLGTCITKAQQAMERLGVRGEVVVADNGSTDGSAELAEGLGARVVRVSRKGYGVALSAGCEAAHGRFILMGDADDSYDFSAIDAFVEQLRTGWDVVWGTRFQGEIRPGAMPWLNRHIGNPLLTAILRTFFKVRISDAHCGMRAFTKRAFELMDLRSPGMEFNSEMLIKIRKLGLQITEVPITLYPDGRERPPHLRPLSDGWRNLKLILLYSPTGVFLVPGGFLFLVGLVLMVAQVFAPESRPLFLFGLRFDFHWAIVGSTLSIVGYQILTVYFFARIYSVTHRLQEEDSILRRGFRLLSLERVLVLAAIVTIAGLVLDAIVATAWLRSGFGPLLPGHTRMFVFGSTLIALGVQTFFNAFFFSILGDRYQRDLEESAPRSRDR